MPRQEEKTRQSVIKGRRVQLLKNEQLKKALKTEVVELERPNHYAILDTYELRDIYNMGETALFYQQEDIHSLASKQLEGYKASKQHVALAFCTNGDGSDKLPPLVIGHYPSPRCFKNVNMKTLGCTYFHSEKAWMTTELFFKWLKAFEARMERLGKERVILLLDNFTGHKASRYMDLPMLRRTMLLYLPANTTSNVQPLDAGIINNFKLYYRKRFNIHILQCLEEQLAARGRASMDTAYGITRPAVPILPLKQLTDINLGKAIDLLVRAWGDVSSRTIQNCFSQCRIKTPRNATEQEWRQLFGEDLDEEILGEVQRTQQSIADLGRGAFRRCIDVRALLNNGNCESDMEAEYHMACEELLNADADEDKDENEEDDPSGVEGPIISRSEAKSYLDAIVRYMQREKEDFVTEIASIRTLLDHVESKRILNLEQTTINDYFSRTRR